MRVARVLEGQHARASKLACWTSMALAADVSPRGAAACACGCGQPPCRCHSHCTRRTRDAPWLDADVVLQEVEDRVPRWIEVEGDDVRVMVFVDEQPQALVQESHADNQTLGRVRVPRGRSRESREASRRREGP
jgi:hypothetical protein